MSVERALALIGILAAAAAAYYARGPFLWMREDRKRRTAAEDGYRELLGALERGHLDKPLEVTPANEDAVALGVSRGAFTVRWNGDGRRLVSRAPSR